MTAQPDRFASKEFVESPETDVGSAGCARGMPGIGILGSLAGCVMSTFYAVEVADTKPPLFPDSCVVCGQDRAEKLVSILLTDEASRVDFFLFGLPLRPAQGSTLVAPV
jgi:hypothetical protein